MIEIRPQSGFVECKLIVVGEVTVTFNPTDMSLIERVFSTFDMLDAMQEEYGEKISNLTDYTEVFEIAKKIDKDMKNAIDRAFEQPVCDELLKSCNVFMLADGLPVWANIMLSIIDLMDETFTAQKKATNPRLQKYTAKYKRAGA